MCPFGQLMKYRVPRAADTAGKAMTNKAISADQHIHLFIGDLRERPRGSSTRIPVLIYHNLQDVGRFL
jgi:hypothetical protein